MSIKFRAIRITGEVKLEDIAEAMQKVLVNFLNPINYSGVFYRDPGNGDTIATMVAFQNKDVSYLDLPDPRLRSSISFTDKKYGFWSAVVSNFRRVTDEKEIAVYISRIVSVAVARELSAQFEKAAALIVSDALCECGYINFQSGVAENGVLVSPDGKDKKVSIRDGRATVSEYSVNEDYRRFFFEYSDRDVEEFLGSLEYLGRIKLMEKKKLIPRVHFETEKA